MVDIFKSAIDAAFGAGSSARLPGAMGFGGSSSAANGGVRSDFTGQIVDVGNIRLKIGNQIAEGGYALVFIAYDVKTNKEYALKRLFAADDAANKAIAQEISFLKKLSGHPHIVPYIAAASSQDTTLHRTEYLLLTEYCSGGRLYERTVYRSRPFEAEQVIQIFYQICRAVKHMHEQKPAIIHRDLKVENCLITSTGFIQLCDFGSATTKTYLPDETWSVKKREYVEDEMTKVTTPMYRAPEMLDTYSNHPINEQVDVWALGCLLYYLCFINHPFEDSAKLRILNAKYTIPANDTKYTVLHDVIRTMLQIDPRQRPTIHTVVENIEDLAIGNDIGLNEPLRFLFNPNETPASTSLSTSNSGAAGAHAPPAPSRPPVVGNHPSAPGGAGSFLPASIKGLNTSVGKSWMKSFLDTSTKVINGGVQQVKQTLATNAPSSTIGGNPPSSTHHHFEVDLSYITSRLIVMATPRDIPSELAGRQSAELIRDLLDTKHSQSYMLYALDPHRGPPPYRREIFHNRVTDLALFDDKHAPRLVDLLCFCQNITAFLLESSSNTAVLHCSDGRNQSALGACALLAYHGVFAQVDQIVRFFESRRCAHPMLTMSHKRYIQYLCDLSMGQIERPHFMELIIKTINLSPVPLFNRERNGCRPYVDVFNQEHKKIFSTYQDPNKLRVFTATDGVCLLPLNIPFNGDLTLHISHAPVGLSLHAHDGGIRICELTINSNFCSVTHSELSYSRYELDGIDSTEKYPPSFRLTLDTVPSKKPPSSSEQEAFARLLEGSIRRPQCLFRDEAEFRQTLNEYETRLKNQAGDGHQFHPSYTTEPSPSPSPSPTPSPIVDRSRKLNIDSSSSSPHTSQRLSGTTSVSPQSPASFVNPRHNPFQTQQSQVAPTSPAPPPPPPTEEKPIAVGTLLDIMGDESNEHPSFERSTSSSTTDAQQHIFHLSLDSQLSSAPPPHRPTTSDLLNVDFDAMPMDKPILHRNASATTLPPPIQATTAIPNQHKAISNQNINRSDPFSGLLSSMSEQNKTASNESLASKQQKTAAATTSTSLNNPIWTPPNYKVNLNNDPPPPPQPAQQQPQSNVAKQTPPSWRPPTSTGAFDDLVFTQSGLKDFGSKAREGTATLADKRKVDYVKDVDPTVLRVREWTEGKKKNIRALLCSLTNVTWPECGWKGCQMHELITPDQVKKAYRKAVIHIHPDKLRGDPNEELAKMIFMELNEGWAQFEQDGAKSLV